MKKEKYIVKIEMPDGDAASSTWVQDALQAEADVEDEGRWKVSAYKQLEEFKTMTKIANKINRMLPLYVPASARFTDRLQLAIWNCGHCKYHNNLWQTLKDIRITVRKNHQPILVIKKGAV